MAGAADPSRSPAGLSEPSTWPEAGLLDSEVWEEVAAAFEADARASGGEPVAARLWHEAGRIHEEMLDRPRQAALCYQTAFRIDPRHRANLHSARRLFAGVENWSMVAQLLQAEARQEDDETRRIALLVERALVLGVRLGRPTDAAAALEEAGALAPDHAGVMLLSADAALRSGPGAAGAAEALRRLALASGPGRFAALAWGRAAVLLEATRPEAALDGWRQALAADPEDARAAQELARLRDRLGHEDRIAALEAAAGHAAHPEERLELLRRAAALAGVLGRHELEVRLLERAASRADGDTALMQDLAEAYEAAERPEACAELLLRIARTTPERALRVATTLRAGRLLDAALDRPEQAAEAWRTLAEAEDAPPEALSALGRLYHRLGRWPDLIWTFRREAELTADPRERAARLFRIAQVQLHRMEDPAAAASTLEAALALAPDFAPAQQALARLYEREGRWTELLALYEARLSRGGPDDHRNAGLLEDMARLLEDRLGDPAGAARLWERLAALPAQGLHALRALERLQERLEAWRPLVDTLERQATGLADQQQALLLLHRACEILEERLGDRDTAAAAWRRLLDLQPTYLPALEALGRLHHRKGRWRELVEMHRLELEVTTDPLRMGALLTRLGEILEHHLMDEAGAIAAHTEALRARPDHLESLWALRRLHARRGEYAEVIRLMRREAAILQVPETRAAVLCRAARVAETRLDRPEESVALLTEALAIRPDLPAALAGLIRLHAVRADWRGVAAVRERQLASAPAALRVELRRELARLWGERLHDPQRAVAAWQAVLEDAPDDLEAAWALDGLSAGTPEEARARLALAAVLPPAEPRPTLVRHAATLLEAAGESEADLHWRSLLAADPSDELAAAHVELRARRRRDAAALRKLYEGLRARARGEARLDLALRLVDACRTVGDVAGATAALEEVLAEDPTRVPALRRLRAVRLDAGRLDEIAALLEREGEAARDPARAAGLLLEAGELLVERHGDAGGAERAWRKALGRSALDRRAHDRLAGLLEAQGRWAELAQLLAARGERLPGGPAAADALAAAAAAWRRVPGTGDRLAWAALEAACARAPERWELQRRLADLGWTLEDWPEAARAYVRLLEQTPPVPVRVHALLRLGQLHEAPLADPARAAAWYEDVLQLDPRHLQALERLGSLQRASGDLSGAAVTFARWADAADVPAVRGTALLELADVHRRLGDPEAARPVLEEARRIPEAAVESLRRLAELHAASAAWPALADVLRERLARDPAAEPEVAARLQLELGRVEEVHLGRPEAARAAYEAACELDPPALEPRLARARLGAAGRDRHAPGAWRAVLEVAPAHAEAWTALQAAYVARGEPEGARVAQAVLSILGRDAAGAPAAPAIEPPLPAAPLDPEGWEVLREGVDGPLARLLRAAGRALARAHAQATPPALEGARRLSGREPHPLRVLTEAVAAALEAGEHQLWVREGGPSFELVACDPVALVVCPPARPAADGRLRLQLGRALAHLHEGTVVAAALGPTVLADLLEAALLAAGLDPPGLGRPDRALVRRVARALGRRGRQEVADLEGLSTLTLKDVEAFLRRSRRLADRAGLAVAGDLTGALRRLAGESGWRLGPGSDDEPLPREMADALRFLSGEGFLRLRRRLGLAEGS